MMHAISPGHLTRLHRLTAGFSLALLLAALLSLAGLGSARAEVAAQADFVHGQVTAARSGDASRTLVQGGEVYDQDTIRTATSARAQLRFTDGSLVSLMPETTFSVQEYRLDDDGSDGSLVFNLLSGGLRTVTGAIGKTRHEAYELKTPVGTLGIRGTEFTAVLNPPGTLRVHVGRGLVVLSNDHGELDVGQGESAIMTLGQAPSLSDQAPDTGAMPAGGVSPLGDMAMPDPAIQTDPMGIELPLPALQGLDGLVGTDNGALSGGSTGGPGGSTGGSGGSGGCPPGYPSGC